jgi:uncharacterized protein with HEPN domain
VRDDRERVLDMREAIERIERYSSRGRQAFDAEELVQSWVVRHLQVIGEVARSLSPDFRDRHPEIPWAEIIGMRTILVHRYFDIDRDLVWSVVEEDLPALKARLDHLVAQSP